jgi:hypothetical protein
LRSKPLLVLAASLALFHLGNAAMLPLSLAIGSVALWVVFKSLLDTARTEREKVAGVST